MVGRLKYGSDRFGHRELPGARSTTRIPICVATNAKPARPALARCGACLVGLRFSNVHDTITPGSPRELSSPIRP